MSDDPVLTALARLEAGQAALRADLLAARADLMERMDRLQNAILAMQDDITVNFGRADRTGHIARGASDEVRALGAEVAAMERQIRRLRSDLDDVRNASGAPGG